MRWILTTQERKKEKEKEKIRKSTIGNLGKVVMRFRSGGYAVLLSASTFNLKQRVVHYSFRLEIHRDQGPEEGGGTGQHSKYVN